MFTYFEIGIKHRKLAEQSDLSKCGIMPVEVEDAAKRSPKWRLRLEGEQPLVCLECPVLVASPHIDGDQIPKDTCDQFAVAHRGKVTPVPGDSRSRDLLQSMSTLFA